MEGLIPLVYKALKKNKTRRQYECLSSGAALGYNPADFYINDAELNLIKTSSVSTENGNNAERKFHRRFYSVEDLSATAAAVAPSPPRKQLVRFRSHRRMFSCVTGG
ncbi:uncharacterized protein LOC110627958 [Manihot esculenta]|uniref:Uncharacterized protein n=1 Tax=Manihot esculenta TaxID=3983 RepID=A0A2C9WH24_MANES|nr:uncharacterized protein LOC110627958 [Manihot esculenta]OAY59164.1 hypothetical protein MANES_01G009800v8 [Manihot esculenta]